ESLRPSRPQTGRSDGGLSRVLVHRAAGGDRGRVAAGSRARQSEGTNVQAMKSFGERIADLLIADGLLTQKQLGEVLESQKKQGGRLLKLLLERQFVSDLDMTAAMARCLNT